MCGIFCCIVYNQNTFLNEISKKGPLCETHPQFAALQEAFLCRGPDAYSEIDEDVSECTFIRFAGSVLWTQGSSPVSQPIVDEDGNVLLWNGDIFSGALAQDGNDTEALSAHLLQVTRNDEDLPGTFSQLRGPYSFIFYHKASKRVYFGRDVIGRHSLIVEVDQRNVTISSISSRLQHNAVEVPANGIFWFDLTEDGFTPISLRPWSHLPLELIQLKLMPLAALGNIAVLEPIESCLYNIGRSAGEPTAADLALWVVFRQEMSMSQLMDKLNTSDSKTRIKRTMVSLSEKPEIQLLVQQLLDKLKESVRLRVQKLPSYCQECVKIKLNESQTENEQVCRHTKVAILFSGGLDSAILAVLADLFVPADEPIDLLNIAFERSKDCVDPKLTRRLSTNGVFAVVQEMTYKVPDRETGLQTLSELRALLPKRTWNFIEINVTQEELKKQREEKIADLIHPLNTILDDSLGCALWFASRGKGLLLGVPKTPYNSPARIVLSGIGADEQLGGYMRHRTTLLHKGGWPALEKELHCELGRIAERNLGRDDRMASSHARQCRMPYLDEDLVNLLASLPPWKRCNPVESMPPGLGDKILLRLVAWHLGLRAAANFPKRAMQFGSRIANSREKGTDVSDRLL